MKVLGRLPKWVCDTAAGDHRPIPESRFELLAISQVERDAWCDLRHVDIVNMPIVPAEAAVLRGATAAAPKIRAERDPDIIHIEVFDEEVVPAIGVFTERAARIHASTWMAGTAVLNARLVVVTLPPWTVRERVGEFAVMASTRLRFVFVVEKLTKPDSKSSKKRMSPGAAWRDCGKTEQRDPAEAKSDREEVEPVLEDALCGAQGNSVIGRDRAHRRDTSVQSNWILRPRVEAT